MSKELTTIKGIGLNTANELVESGFDTIDAIAKSTPEDLGKIKGFGPARAAKVIAMAKELTQDVEKTVEVSKVTEITTQPSSEVSEKTSEVSKKTSEASEKSEPVAASEEKKGLFATLRMPLVFVPAALIVFLLVSALYLGNMNGLNILDSTVNSIQEFTNTTVDKTEQQDTNDVAEQASGPVYTEQTATDDMEKIESDIDAMNSELMQQSEPVWVAKRRVPEPEWITRQRAQANEYREIQRVNADKYRDMQQAKANQYREQSWNRYLSSLPPAQAQRAKQQRDLATKQQLFVMKQQAVAMKQMVEARKRHLAMIKQRNEYIRQRYGS